MINEIIDDVHETFIKGINILRVNNLICAGIFIILIALISIPVWLPVLAIILFVGSIKQLFFRK